MIFIFPIALELYTCGFLLDLTDTFMHKKCFMKSDNNVFAHLVQIGFMVSYIIFHQ